MRNFIIWMLGWWTGFIVAGIVYALVMVELVGMNSDSPGYGLPLVAFTVIGGIIGVRMTSRFRKSSGARLT